MDPRQPPQHPFSSRNTASPYGQHTRNPFPPASNQAAFPPSSHPPPAAPSFAEHQRRPSDPPYYSQQRSFGQDGQPMGGQGHSRHQSASAIGHGPPMNRNMPPPSSPQQQVPQPSHHYGPPAPRGPPVSVGPPTNFPNSRDLPSLPPLGGGPRPPSTGSMSIMSMLGNQQGSREPPQHFSPVATSGPPPNPRFGPHGSPQVHSAASDYPAYRRPMTPEVRRYEPRDHRANSAGSPTNLGQPYSTPESRKFGTPQQGYGQRALMEERREPARIPNPNVPPPRPNSQPSAFNGPHRISEQPRPIHNEGLFARRVDNVPRAPEQHNRVDAGYTRPPFEERQVVYGYAERERQEREAMIRRERERQDREAERERAIEVAAQREREQRDRAEHEHNLQRELLHQMAQRNAQAAGFNRPPEPPREQPLWNRPTYEQPRPEYDPAQPSERQRYEHQVTSAPQHPGPAAYATNEPRYGPPPQIPMPQPNHPPYEISLHERLQLAQQQQQQLRQQQLQYGGPPSSQEYQPQESPQRRPIDDGHQMQQQRSFLGVQELNRKGRVSPLPQAVQGVQGQLNGPGGQPSIKNEFGRMFSGIGSGVGSAMGMASPVSAGAQNMPFSNPGQLRREDLEHLQDSPIETGAHKVVRSASRGGRRRKLKEEDSRDGDEGSTGRNTPSGRGKRAKTHHHHHHHHHHHRPDAADNASSPSMSNLTPFKSVKGSAIPSPPGLDGKSVHHHHVPRHHHHHVTAKPAPQTIVPLSKLTVRSQAVLDSVAHLTRYNLGHEYYESKLKTRSTAAKRNLTSNRGFASTPKALPNFAGKQNSTYTIKVPPVYLAHTSREEITRRKAVWGTDVYTDDSDVIAACIHQGWFRGAWSDDVDVSLLDLEIDVPNQTEAEKTLGSLITSPPPTGPMEVPDKCECHITILILPALKSYKSTTRFGIMSREWGLEQDGYQGVHDGLSFSIISIKFLSVSDGQSGRTGTLRSKIFAQQLNDQELQAEESEANFLGNGREMENGNGEFATSSVRDSEFVGIGTNSWWKKPVKLVPAKQVRKEEREKSVVPPPVMSPISPIVRPPVQALSPPPPPPPLLRQSIHLSQRDQLIQQITQRMVANANPAARGDTDGDLVSGIMDEGGVVGGVGRVDMLGREGVVQGAQAEEIIRESESLEDTLADLGRERATREREGMAAAILAFGLDGKGGSVGSISL